MSEISAKQPDMLHLFTTYEVIMIIISRAYYQRYGSKTNFHRKMHRLGSLDQLGKSSVHGDLKTVLKQ